jgi:predicted small lipoprotein YifL
MAKAALLFVLVTLAACGKSGPRPASPEAAKQAEQLCAAIRASGLARQCSVDDRDLAVDVVIDATDDEAARQACAALAGRLVQRPALPAQMKLRIFSPYRSDKALATCPLHAAAGPSGY